MSRRKEKRCKSYDTLFNQRCCKVRDHQAPLHQNGALVWGDQASRQGHTASRVVLDETVNFVAPAPPRALHTTGSPLDEWWADVAKEESDQVVAKAREYGATDLIDIGQMLARTMGRVVDDEEAAELGVFFYLVGKLSRWQSAVQRGDRPSNDTILDIGVYCRMAQRIRHSGSWPGEKEQP